MSILKYVLYIIANINHVIDNTDTSYNGVDHNCTISCTDVVPSKSNEKILMIALIYYHRWGCVYGRGYTVSMETETM